MKTASILGTIAASVLLTLGIQHFILSQNPVPSSVKKETAHERVMRTNTLRCAYALYPPMLAKDPNSGKLSGVYADVMAEFEVANGLKVVWGPEIDWGDISATLQSGKADAFCAGGLLTPKRGRVIAGSLPVIYTFMEAYARADDHRFDNNRDRINQSDVRIEVNAGDISEELAQRIFPQAQRVYKSALGDESQLFLDVDSGKADVKLSGPSNLSVYNKNNSAMALRKIDLPNPLMPFQSVISVDINEQALLHLINATVRNLIDVGSVERIVKLHTGADYGTAYIAPKPQTN